MERQSSDTVPMLYYYDDVIAAQDWLATAYGLMTARQHSAPTATSLVPRCASAPAW